MLPVISPSKTTYDFPLRIIRVIVNLAAPDKNPSRGRPFWGLPPLMTNRGCYSSCPGRGQRAPVPLPPRGVNRDSSSSLLYYSYPCLPVEPFSSPRCRWKSRPHTREPRFRPPCLRTFVLSKENEITPRLFLSPLVSTPGQARPFVFPATLLRGRSRYLPSFRSFNPPVSPGP